MSRILAPLLVIACLPLLLSCGQDSKGPPGPGDIQAISSPAGSAQVKLGRIADPVPPSDVSQAAAGRRLVAVELTVANLGKQQLKFVPVSDVKLKTTAGDAPSTVAKGTICPQKVQVKVLIPAGEIKVVCAVFQPQDQAKLTGVSVSLPGTPVGSEKTWQIGKKQSE